MIIESMECSLGIALLNLERVYLQKKKIKKCSRLLFSMTQMYKTFGLEFSFSSWYFESELWVVLLVQKACDALTVSTGCNVFLNCACWLVYLLHGLFHILKNRTSPNK